MNTSSIAIADLLNFLRSRGAQVPIDTTPEPMPMKRGRGRPKLMAPPHAVLEISRLYCLNFKRLQAVVNEVHNSGVNARRLGQVGSADLHSARLADGILRIYLRDNMGFHLPPRYFRDNIDNWRHLRQTLIRRGHTRFFICGRQYGKGIANQVLKEVKKKLLDFVKINGFAPHLNHSEAA